jgi:hypothetical protein
MMIVRGGGIVVAALAQLAAAARTATSVARENDLPALRIFMLDMSCFVIRIVDTEKQML